METMNDEQIMFLWNRHRRLTDFLVRHYHRKLIGFGVSRDEVRSECVESFMKAIRIRTDPRVQIHTLYHRILRNRITDIIRDHVPVMEVEDRHWVTELTPESTAEFLDDLKEIGKDALHVCHLILEHPDSVFGTSGALAPREARGKLVGHLREHNWSWPRIWNSFGRIKEALR